MIDHLISLALVPAWIACTSGWAGWVAVYALIAPWRFLR